MCDFDYEKLFSLRRDDDLDLLRITEDLQRQMMVIDDDDDEDMNKANLAAPHSSLLKSAPGTATGEIHTGGSTELRSRQGAKGLPSAVITPPRNAPRTSRGMEPVEGQSFSSSHSRGQPQLTSSGAQTPTQASNENSNSRLPGLAAAPAPPSELGGPKMTPALAQDAVPKPVPPYSYQEDCPPPYGWAGGVPAKQPHGVTAMPQNHQNVPAQNIRPGPSTHSPPQLPYTAYASNAQMMASNGFPAGLQARPMMLQPQSQQPQPQSQPQPQLQSQPQPPMQPQLQPQPQPPLQPQPQLQPQLQPQPQPQSVANGAMVQSLNVNQQPPVLPPSIPHLSDSPIQHDQHQPQSQTQHVTGTLPPGYAQVLVPVRTADGTTGYQLMVLSTQHLSQGGSNFSSQLIQAQMEQHQLQQQPRPHSQPQSQQPQQPQHQQPQTMMQYMWQPPPQAQSQHQYPPQQPQPQLQPQLQPQPHQPQPQPQPQPQHQQQQQQQQQQQPGSIPQQFLTPQYANITSAPQRYALVSANGQQQYLMALTLNPLQQVQQQQQQQQQQPHLQQQAQQQQLQQHSHQFQQQLHSARPVYLTSQQPQPMFTTSMIPSGMPPGYRFN